MTNVTVIHLDIVLYIRCLIIKIGKIFVMVMKCIQTRLSAALSSHHWDLHFFSWCKHIPERKFSLQFVNVVKTCGIEYFSIISPAGHTRSTTCKQCLHFAYSSNTHPHFLHDSSGMMFFTYGNFLLPRRPSDV